MSDNRFCLVVAGSIQDEVLSEVQLRTILATLEGAFSGQPGLKVTLHIRESAEQILALVGTPP